ncbi:hypothetical protein N7526_008650 [Penicillium atrosanguineum]|nr:hypothetical protein N7526_008650 [Penicillium atrosanguineum]
MLNNKRVDPLICIGRYSNKIQSDKINPRAEVSFLSGKVRFIRDAVFDESRKYSPKFAYYQPIPLPLIKEPQELDRIEVQKAI